MSRNRCSTSCECGFWSFQRGTDNEVPVNDPGLMTQAEYLKAIGWENCPYNENGGRSACAGWSFRDDLNGKTFPAWRSKNGMGWTNASIPCGGAEGWNYEPQVYGDVPPDQRYRYRKVTCPLCRRSFVGWYVQQPKIDDDDRCYEIYDTSFWHAFNDEPSDKDEEGVINWTPETVAQALREFAERHQIEPKSKD